MGLAIVAIPEENDRVWKISSEKVPHLTLLFLGDAATADLQTIMQFVEHAVTLSEHGPFYLDVDRRGTLGEAEADVVFFNKRSWNLKWVKQFRAQLLQNQAIRTAYDSTEQFGAPQEWVPHVTLGYPQTPAKPLENDDHPLYSVCFDRIAVWEGEYEGPDFRLEWPDRELEGDLAVAYSDTQKAALAHYGVKGMRWGQKKTETVTVGGKTKQVTPKKAAKLDKKWEKNQFTLPKGIERHNAMAEHFNQRIGALNDKYGKDDFSKEAHDEPARWSPRYKQYNNEVMGLQEKSFRHAVETVHGSSPTGKKKMEVTGDIRADTMRIVVKDASKVEHAAVGDEDEVFLFQVTRNATGLITGAEPMEDAMSQTAELGEEFLEHYGKKGMRWGIRNDLQGRNRFEPEGHSAGNDVAKLIVFPPGANAPAFIRLAKRGGRKINQSTKAYKEKRNNPERVAERQKRKLARRDFYWEMHAYSDISHSDVHNKVADEIDSKVYQLASAPKYRGKNLKADKKLQDEYDQDVAKVTDAAYRRSVKDTYGVNPSGTKKAEYVNDARGARIEIRDLKSGKTLSEKNLNPVEEDINNEDSVGHTALSHAEAAKFEDPDIMMTVKVNDQGFITEIGRVKLPEDEEGSIAQSATMGEAFAEGLIHGAPELGEAFILEHYGIKGMRWGFRRSSPEAVAPTAASKVPHGTKRKTKIETDGGENHPAHEDAIKVAQAKTKLKKSGPAALSNQELREVANRIQLENQVTLLSSSKGKQFVKRQLQNEGQNLAREGIKRGAKKGAQKVGSAVLL